jgi:hypothetical protein
MSEFEIGRHFEDLSHRVTALERLVSRLAGSHAGGSVGPLGLAPPADLEMASGLSETHNGVLASKSNTFYGSVVNLRMFTTPQHEPRQYPVPTVVHEGNQIIPNSHKWVVNRIFGNTVTLYNQAVQKYLRMIDQQGNLACDGTLLDDRGSYWTLDTDPLGTALFLGVYYHEYFWGHSRLNAYLMCETVDRVWTKRGDVFVGRTEDRPNLHLADHPGRLFSFSLLP